MVVKKWAMKADGPELGLLFRQPLYVGISFPTSVPAMAPV